MRNKRRVIALTVIAIMIMSLGTFSWADGEPVQPDVRDLIAGKHHVVGTVTTWHDCEYLYVKYLLNQEAIDDGWYLSEVHLHVQDGDFPVPVTKKGNPIPGKFNYTEEHLMTDEYDFMIPIQDNWTCGYDLTIAAHAVVSREVCEVLVEADSATYYSDTVETMVVDGSIVGPNYPFPAVEAYGTGVTGFESSYWDTQLDYTFDPAALWIWGTPVVTEEVLGEDYWFEREFEIPGPVISATLHAATDNGMAVYLNDPVNWLYTANLPLYPVLYDYTESYVPSQGWQTTGVYDLTSEVAQGMNTLWFHCANEQMDGGTVDSNPAGLKYQLDVAWDEVTECCMEHESAWAEGDRFVSSTWAMYYNYTLCDATYHWEGEFEPRDNYTWNGDIIGETVYFDVTFCEFCEDQCGVIHFDLPGEYEDVTAEVTAFMMDYEYWDTPNLAAVGTLAYNEIEYYYMFLINDEKIWISLTLDDYADEWSLEEVTAHADRIYQLHSIDGEYILYP